MSNSNIVEISQVKVMQSNAGYYIGQSCTTEFEDGYQLEEPYCRDSNYFATFNEASDYLAYISSDDEIQNNL